MSFREKIQFMLDLGFTYGQIAKICNCHSTSISKWMRGESNISERMIESIETHIKSFIQQLEEVWSDKNA